MKKQLIWISIILIGSHIILEASEIMERIWPSLKEIYIYPVKSSDFKPKWYVENGINILWWLKYNCDDLVWCISYLTMARIAFKYSFRLFLIIGLFFIYHIADTLLLWWNFKSAHWFYWALLCVIAISIVIIVYPVRNKQGIIKQFK